MEIKSLQDCKFVSDVVQVGTVVEFKTVLYSPVTMEMEHVTISCPVSGNYVLTDVAKIVEGDIGIPDSSHKELLAQVFSSLEESTQVSDLIDKKQILPDSSETRIQALALSFLRELSEEEQKKDSEELKFQFLRICSDNFQKAYERHTNR